MKWSMICFGFVKVTFGDSDPGFSLAIKEWTGTAPGFPSGVTNVYFWLLSCIRTSYCLGPAWDNLCVDNVRLNVEVKGNYAIMAIMWHCSCMHLLYLKEKDDVAQDDHINQQRSGRPIGRRCQNSRYFPAMMTITIMITPDGNVSLPISSSAWVSGQEWGADQGAESLKQQLSTLLWQKKHVSSRSC